MAKLSQYSSPEWQANPNLAQVREALEEVRHLKDVLETLEKVFGGGVQPRPFSNAHSLLIHHSSQAPFRLKGWLASLNESYVGMQYLWTERSMQGVAASHSEVAALTRELQAADFKWGSMKTAAVAAVGAKKLIDDIF